MKLFTEFLKDDAGATAIEYGLIAAATGLVLVAVMDPVSTALKSVFTQISDSMAGSVDGGGTDAGG